MRLLFTIIAVFSSAIATGEPEWQHIKDKNSVAVYTKLEPENSYKTSKAIGFANTTPQQVFGVLNDVNSYSNWFAFAKTVKLLKKTKNTMYVYVETGFPWPFRNQDMVYEISYADYDDGSAKYTLLGKPDYLPVNDGIKRMHSAKGYFFIQPNKDHTQITYVMHAKLGGQMPPSLANRHMHELPLQTLNQLIELAERNKG